MILEEPINEVLAVDEAWQIVFVHREARQAILAVHYNGSEWVSEAIVEGVGVAGGEGVFDARNRILYSTHATMETDLPLLHPMRGGRSQHIFRSGRREKFLSGSVVGRGSWHPGAESWCGKPRCISEA